MGVFKKLKDVLFDVEDDELPVIQKTPKKEEVKEENPIKEIKIPKEDYSAPEVKEPRKESFNFPIDFDEPVPSRTAKKDYLFDDDFDVKPASHKEPLRDYREPRRYDEPAPKRKDAPDYSKILTRETKKEAFKPSPVISPVYGILDQNYTKDDVIIKTDVGIKNPTLDDALKKAHGIKKKEEKIFDENFEEPPLKTLDEILIAKDKKVEVKKEEKEEDELPIVKKESMLVSKAETENIKLEDDSLPDEPYADEKKETTLEDDLFNLIDSMYEEKEEEE